MDSCKKGVDLSLAGKELSNYVTNLLDLHFLVVLSLDARCYTTLREHSLFIVSMEFVQTFFRSKLHNFSMGAHGTTRLS
jgi:hypothetical protein